MVNRYITAWFAVALGNYDCCAFPPGRNLFGSEKYSPESVCRRAVQYSNYLGFLLSSDREWKCPLHISLLIHWPVKSWAVLSCAKPYHLQACVSWHSAMLPPINTTPGGRALLSSVSFPQWMRARDRRRRSTLANLAAWIYQHAYVSFFYSIWNERRLLQTQWQSWTNQITNHNHTRITCASF